MQADCYFVVMTDTNTCVTIRLQQDELHISQVFFSSVMQVASEAKKTNTNQAANMDKIFLFYTRYVCFLIKILG